MISNLMAKRIVHDLSLPSSQILTLLTIYRILGKRDCFDAKFIEIAEELPLLSRSSVYDAIHGLEEKGYIRIEESEDSYIKKIYRTDGSLESGYIKLTYNIFDKLFTDKRVASSPSALRSLLYILLNVFSNEKRVMKRLAPVKSLSEEIGVSERTILRVFNLLKKKNILNITSFKNKNERVAFLLSIPKKMIEIILHKGRTVNENTFGDRFSIRRILRKLKYSLEPLILADLASLITQYKKRYKEAKNSVEKALERAMRRLLEEDREINPKVVHKMLLDNLNKSRVIVSV